MWIVVPYKVPYVHTYISMPISDLRLLVVVVWIRFLCIAARTEAKRVVSPDLAVLDLDLDLATLSN